MKDADGKTVGCHTSKQKAQAQLSALYAQEAQMVAMKEEIRAEMDDSPWDANKAMSACQTAADYRQICAGEHTTGEPDQRQHWALPHHYLGKGPNASGVQAARQRFAQTEGLKDRVAVRRHLFETHSLPSDEKARLPRENLVRALMPGANYEVRAASDGTPPTLTGHFAVFDQWSEIDSIFEGHFMERIAPGAFKKTFTETRDRVKVTFNHGHDPDLGDKVLGPISTLEEDGYGARYEVPLFGSVPPLVMEGLREGVYGSSFRFRVMREEMEEEPEASDQNPHRLPERTIKEVELYEFGPVTFPAYEGATAGVRSLTDEEHFARLTRDPKRLSEIIDFTRKSKEPASEPTPADATSEPAGLTLADIPTADKHKETKEDEMAIDIDRFDSLELLAARRKEIDDRTKYLHAEWAGKQFPDDVQGEWDGLLEEVDALDARMKHLRDREAELQRRIVEGKTESGEDHGRPQPFNAQGRKVENIYDLSEYRRIASTASEERRLYLDGAKRSIETSPIHMGNLSPEEARARALRTLERLEGGDEENDPAGGRLAAYYLAVGSPTYRRAFGKFAMAAPVQAMFSSEEANSVQQAKGYAERAFTLGSTGLPVPYQLDPTIIPTSNGSVNPFRVVSRIVQTTVNEWRGATSGGITAAYAAEGTETSDNTPTLAQPVIPAVRAQAFVPFSIEVGQDWPAVEAEMTQEVVDAKDDLEATKFTLGTGTNEPSGIIPGGTTTATTTTAAFVVADTYKLEESVAPRFRPRSSVIGNRAILNKIRQFDTAGGSGVWLDVPGLAQRLPSGNGVQMPRGMLGYPTFEDTAMDAVLTTGSEILVMGDFRYYIIVDRVGMSADLIPHLVGTNHRPTGQRGLFFFWRNGAERVSDAAFRVLQT